MLNILYEKFDLSRRVVISEVKILSFREYMLLAHKVELPSFTLEEILANAPKISSDLALENPKLYKYFLLYLQIGQYPFFMEDEDEFRNKLFNALEKVINEDIPSLNRIDFSHLSIFKKFIAKLIYAKVPYKVNISALSKEFGISHPTLTTYINILEQSKILNPVRKYSENISKKPEKLFFNNTNILYAFADEFGVEVDRGTMRETFFTSCFTSVYYSDVGDFKIDSYIFEIGGKSKSFKQIKDLKNSFVVVDTDYVSQKGKVPLWLLGLIE